MSDRERIDFLPAMKGDKICPYMTTAAHSPVACQKIRCQLWTSVSTTEGLTTHGCAHELQPNINMDGRFNV